jgi:tRNA(Ile)-lysidine synthase
MHPLEKETLKILQQEQLVKAGDSVVVAVSAGPDSMALLHVLARLAADLNITLTAVYVNHGLRPDETLQEEELVKEITAGLGVDCRIGSVNVKDTAFGRKLSIEHAARILRYELLEDIASEVQAQKIGVAHTADDQAEEILLRILRGTARKGMSGMQSMRDNRIIRPFLTIPKFRLLDYLDRYSIPYLEDSSNQENIYLRNRIRNDLLPYLAENYNPNIHQNLLRMANVLQDEEKLLEKLTDAAWEKIIESLPAEGAVDGTGLLKDLQQGKLLITLQPFNQEPRAIQRRILEKCCWQMDCKPSASQVEQLLGLAKQTGSGNSLHLSEGLRVQTSTEQMIFSYPQGRTSARGDLETPERDTDEFKVELPGPGTYEIAGLHKKLILQTIPGKGFTNESPFPAGEYLDSSLFAFPLTLRFPKPGDRFHPLGAPGSKKVFDFLSEQKIARLKRVRIPILLADDVILALPGLRINHRYRITDKTSQILQITLEDI